MSTASRVTEGFTRALTPCLPPVIRQQCPGGPAPTPLRRALRHLVRLLSRAAPGGQEPLTLRIRQQGRQLPRAAGYTSAFPREATVTSGHLPRTGHKTQKQPTHLTRQLASATTWDPTLPRSPQTYVTDFKIFTNCRC